MNAIELTKHVYALENKLIETERKIQYLEILTEKLELRLTDLEIDVRMSQKMRAPGGEK